MNSNEPLTEIEAGLTDYHRRTYDHTLACLQTDAEGRDMLDQHLDVDPLLMDRPPGRRSKVDADNLLRILDELERREG